MAGQYVDFDTHVYEPVSVWQDYMDPKFRDRAPRWFNDKDGRLLMQLAEHVYPTVPGHPGFANTYGPQSKMDRSGNDPHVRLKKMDADNTDIHVVFPTLGMVGFSTAVGDPGLALAQTQAYNRYMAEYTSVDRRRLRGAILVPVNHPELAAQELHRVHKETGQNIIYMNPTPPGDIPWHHPSRDPFWQAANDLGMTLVFHESTIGAPKNAVTIGRFTTAWPLIYLATHVVEVMFAYADIILGGTLERFPKVKVGNAEAHVHWVPSWLALMDQTCGVGTNIFGNKSGSATLSMKPSDYFRRQCFVAAFADDTMIPEVWAQYPESVVAISDWPHPIASEQAALGLGAVARHPGLSDEAKRKVLIDNPTRFI
jgi:predicted TIM-barrel fold metal-dependent hydrolase